MAFQVTCGGANARKSLQNNARADLDCVYWAWPWAPLGSDEGEGAGLGARVAIRVRRAIVLPLEQPYSQFQRLIRLVGR